MISFQPLIILAIVAAGATPDPTPDPTPTPIPTHPTSTPRPKVTATPVFSTAPITVHQSGGTGKGRGLADIAGGIKLSRPTPSTGVVISDSDVKHSSGDSSSTVKSNDQDAFHLGEYIIDAPNIIAEECASDYREDYSMRVYCIKKENAAVRYLKSYRPTFFPEEIFLKIRAECKKDYPRSYSMRKYCEEKERTAYRKLLELAP